MSLLCVRGTGQVCVCLLLIVLRAFSMRPSRLFVVS